MAKKCNVIMTIILISVICATMLCSLLVACDKKEEETPWWKQHEKLAFVLEDERSTEKSLTYKSGDNTPKFHYIRDKNNQMEYIPKVTVYYDGEVKDVVIVVLQRKYYNDNQGRYDSVAWILGLGKFLASFRFYLNNEDANNNRNYFYGLSIDIYLSKGDEK